MLEVVNIDNLKIHAERLFVISIGFMIMMLLLL